MRQEKSHVSVSMVLSPLSVPTKRIGRRTLDAKPAGKLLKGAVERKWKCSAAVCLPGTSGSCESLLGLSLHAPLTRSRGALDPSLQSCTVRPIQRHYMSGACTKLVKTLDSRHCTVQCQQFDHLRYNGAGNRCCPRRPCMRLYFRSTIPTSPGS